MEKTNIPITRPMIGEEETLAAREAILSRWLTQGPRVQEFEKDFAQVVGASHACAVSSCTAALHLALHAIGVGAGDEVITVSHSFIATANAVRYCGARPVLIDIDPSTYNLDPGLIENAVTKRTKAILVVHQMGMPCDLSNVLAIADRLGLPVIEDAACALGSEVRLDVEWDRIGKPHGKMACFSFHPRKVITTGDGGMITTQDAELDHRLRLLRQHGMSISDVKRHQSRTVLFEEYPIVGFNYRLTDVQAAIGRAQLRRLPEILSQRRRIAQRYNQAIEQIPGLRVPPVPRYALPNYQSYPVQVLPTHPLGRDGLMARLLDRGISSRRGIMNVHQEPAYSGYRHCRLPHSVRARDSVILLPLYPEMTDEDVERVLEAIEV